MTILIVDDSHTAQLTIQSILNEAGFSDLVFADTGLNTLEQLGIKEDGLNWSTLWEPDLILLDIILPDFDGRDLCRTIKSVEPLQDVPIIVVTSLTQIEHLEKAFSAGAMDYITKPINSVELLARVRSALRFKQEMDRRKAREQKLLEVRAQLEDVVEQLNLLSFQDGLTGVANRRRFDDCLVQEWNRARRNTRPLSLFVMDIDFFKSYNDTYGHQAGDDCLKQVANALQQIAKRAGDSLFRYGGEEFAAILAETPKKGALNIAELMLNCINDLGIKHENSQISDHVTISIGVSTTLPDQNLLPADLLSAADKALYQAKHAGRNRVEFCTVVR